MYMYDLDLGVVRIECYDGDVIIGETYSQDDVIIKLINVYWYRVDKNEVQFEESFIVYRDEIKNMEILKKSVDMI